MQFWLVQIYIRKLHFSISAFLLPVFREHCCSSEVLCMLIPLTLCSQLCSQLGVPSSVLAICYYHCQTKRLCSNTMVFPPPKASLMPPLLWRHGSKLSYLSYGKHLILNCIIVTFVNNSLLQKMNHVLLVLFFGGGGQSSSFLHRK